MNLILTNQETERLTFRLLEVSDFDEWKYLFETPEAQQFLGMGELSSIDEMCEKWFEKAFHRYENDLGGMNVLVDKSTKKMIGQCGLLVQTVENEERLEIGYSILPEYWGKGYAFEAAKKCRDFAFENLLADELISIIHVDNIGSEKVARKNGMTVEKQLDSYKGMPVNIFMVKRVDWERELI